MLFSLIIPAKNAAQTIFATLKSLINQIDAKYEIIVVDDHSTDETGAIVLHLAEKNNKIRYFFSNDHGVSAARNLGIKKASGDYLIFVDADDQLEYDALHNLSHHIDCNKKSEIIFCGYIRVSDKNEVIKRFSYEYVEGHGWHILPLYLNKNSYTHLGALCFRGDFIKVNHLLFQNFDYAEDIVFVSQALFFADNVSCLRKETYRWTLRQGSILYSNTLNKFNGLRALNYLYVFLQKRRCKDHDTYKAVGNHYAMILLDTVTSLLWMGRTVSEIAEAIEVNANWNILPRFRDQSRKIRRDLFFLKHFRLLYLNYCKKHYVPYNFRKRGIKTYDR